MAAMTDKSSLAFALLAAAAALCASGPAQAQVYGAAYGQQPPPLYPYVMQQPYAVQVAPNTYVIQRPVTPRNYPYVRCQTCSRSADVAPGAPASAPPRKKVDRALIEELRRRSEINRRVVNTTKIVHDAPVVVETQRVVEDPPRVIVRRHVVEDAPAQRGLAETDPGAAARRTREDDGKVRVIRAEAEVTILGPDRMSIRLFRKRGGNAKAQADEQ